MSLSIVNHQSLYMYMCVCVCLCEIYLAARSIHPFAMNRLNESERSWIIWCSCNIKHKEANLQISPAKLPWHNFQILPNKEILLLSSTFYNADTSKKKKLVCFFLQLFSDEYGVQHNCPWNEGLKNVKAIDRVNSDSQ